MKISAHEKGTIHLVNNAGLCVVENRDTMKLSNLLRISPYTFYRLDVCLFL